MRSEHRNEIQLHPPEQQGSSPEKDNDTLVLNFEEAFLMDSKHIKREHQIDDILYLA